MQDTGHSFSAYFKRATSPLVVLALLKERPMYGYQISTTMKDRSGGQYTIAVLYPILYRLKEQDYIEESGTEISGGRARSYYRITAAGRKYLADTRTAYETIAGVFGQHYARSFPA